MKIYIREEHLTSIIGKWKYIDCTMKNTSVYGELNITVNHLAFKGRIAQDFPTEAQQTSVEYKFEDGKLIFIQPDGPQFMPVAPHFLLFEDQLYFSEIAIDKPEWTKENDRRFGANWTYKLNRI